MFLKMRSLSCSSHLRSVPYFPALGDPSSLILSVVGPPAGQDACRPDLRAGLGRGAAGKAVEHLLEQLRRQVLVGVLEDLHHRRIGAHAQALDLLPGEVAIRRQVMRIVVDAPLAHLHQRLGAAQHARRRAAHLHVRLLAHRRELEHRVERRDLVDADVGHAQHVGDQPHGRLRQPASCCSCARHSSGITADACLPGG